MKNPDLVALGKVVRSQGRDGRAQAQAQRKGAHRVRRHDGLSRRGEEFEAFEVESLTLDRNAYILKLKGVDTLAAADALAGRDVLCRRIRFSEASSGDSFYDFEVIGSRVVTRDGAEVGEVAAVLAAGGPVLLVVRRGDGDVYVPFNEAICVKVDPEAGEIVIDPPEGLLDLNEI